MALPMAPLPSSPRFLLAKRFFQGPHLWDVIRPGALKTSGDALSGSTIYGGLDWHTEKFRPWVVIGELANNKLLAVPLNEAPPNREPLWFTPLLGLSELWSDAPKASIAELAHVWALPPLEPFRKLLPGGRTKLEAALRKYFERPERD